jgi:hypothetical protein
MRLRTDYGRCLWCGAALIALLIGALFGWNIGAGAMAGFLIGGTTVERKRT